MAPLIHARTLLFTDEHQLKDCCERMPRNEKDGWHQAKTDFQSWSHWSHRNLTPRVRRRLGLAEDSTGSWDNTAKTFAPPFLHTCLPWPLSFTPGHSFSQMSISSRIVVRECQEMKKMDGIKPRLIFNLEAIDHIEIWPLSSRRNCSKKLAAMATHIRGGYGCARKVKNMPVWSRPWRIMCGLPEDEHLPCCMWHTLETLSSAGKPPERRAVDFLQGIWYWQ